MDEYPATQQVSDDSNHEAPNVPVEIKNPTSIETEAKSNQATHGDITNLEDRIRGAEKWMIWLTAAIAFFALCSVVVGMLQWSAISGGSSDTHDLAVAAKTQAGKMTNMADAAAALGTPDYLHEYGQNPCQKCSDIL